MLIQTGGSQTSGRLAFYHTLFTSKFSCTGGVGHFPRWNACPSAARKRPARARSSSSSAFTILRLGAGDGTWNWRKQSSWSPLRNHWREIYGLTCPSVGNPHSAGLSPASSRATRTVRSAFPESLSLEPLHLRRSTLVLVLDFVGFMLQPLPLT